MGLILLQEYAKRHGKAISSVTQKARRGTFKTAHKIGHQWFIEEDEPYSDERVTSGKYIGSRLTKNNKAKDEE